MAWIKLNATDPAAPAGAENVHFRKDEAHTGAQHDPFPVSAFTHPIPAGGATDEVLTKQTGDDYDVAWQAGGAAGIFDVVIAMQGQPPENVTYPIVTFARTVTFADEFAGSYGTVGTNPTSDALFTLIKTVAGTPTEVGEILVETDGVVTFLSMGSDPLVFDPGDLLSMTTPTTQDATLADIAFTLAGTR